MSHSALTYEAMLCQRRIYELSHGDEGRYSNWPKRLQLVADFGIYVEQICTRIGSSSSPIDILLRVSGKKMHTSLELLLRRPPYRQPYNTVPPWDNYDIMLAATGVLEQDLQASLSELSPWAWKNWIQWYALAVLLTELLVRPKDPLFDRAFTVAMKTFQYYAQVVADSQSGMLWKPVERLMRRVQRIKQGLTISSAQVTRKPLSMTSDNSDEVPHVSNYSSRGNTDLFDLNDWRFDDQATTIVGNDLGPIDQTEDLDYDNIPWQIWDPFLQEIVDI